MQKSSSAFFFLHVFSTLVLFVTAVSFIVVVFQIINIALPDALAESYRIQHYDDELRDALAFLIVSFPMYIASLLYLRKSYVRDGALRNLRSRKWLVNFTLFVAAVTILFFLIAVVMQFLDGELTMQFMLKFFTVTFVASVVALYYKWDEKRYE